MKGIAGMVRLHASRQADVIKRRGVRAASSFGWPIFVDDDDAGWFFFWTRTHARPSAQQRPGPRSSRTMHCVKPTRVLPSLLSKPATTWYGREGACRSRALEQPTRSNCSRNRPSSPMPHAPTESSNRPPYCRHVSNQARIWAASSCAPCPACGVQARRLRCPLGRPIRGASRKPMFENFPLFCSVLGERERERTPPNRT